MSLASEGQPEQFEVEEEDGSGDDPGDHDGEARVDEFAHAAAVVGELDQWNHGEWELEAEDDLTEYEEHADFVFAEDTDHENRRDDGDTARDEAAEPGLEADLEEAFHDDLAGESARESGVLA